MAPVDVFLYLKIAVKSSVPCRADRLQIYIRNTGGAPKVDAVTVLHGNHQFSDFGRNTKIHKYKYKYKYNIFITISVQ